MGERPNADDLSILRVSLERDGQTLGMSYAISAEDQAHLPRASAVRISVDDDATIVLPRRVLVGLLRLLDPPAQKVVDGS